MSKDPALIPAIFLDRDGVIIENRPDYIKSKDEIVPIPGALEALSHIRNYPAKIVIITNQSAIGRGIISLDEAQSINRHVLELIEKAGGRIDGLYMCPHAPADACPCRKPLPGLLIQAAEDLYIDLTQSTLIGDAVSDLQAGRSAGLLKLALVRTGRGGEQEALLTDSLGHFTVFDDLKSALDDWFKAQ
jgi:D-glycero-D-manno-heptose 1,7-bisphosphate phosphatase